MIFSSFNSMKCGATGSTLSTDLYRDTGSDTASCAATPAAAKNSKANADDFEIIFTFLFEFQGFLATILKTGNSRLIVKQFLGLEETVNLNKCILYRIGCMHNVLLTAH